MLMPYPQWKMATCFRMSIWGLLQQRCLATAPPNLYDVLGITPRASSKQIKAAYFRLSKKHHPDRQSGEATKFQQISAAYEVLGNRHQRRVYDSQHREGDHGHRHDAARHGTARHAPQSAAAGSAPYTGRSAHYNYDAWSQAHYREVRWRETKSREEYALAAEKRADRQQERMRGFVACALIVAMTAYVGLLRDEGRRSGASGGSQSGPAPPPPPPPPPH